MKKKYQLILVILLTAVTVFLLIDGLQKEQETKIKITEMAVVYNAEQKDRQEKINKVEQSIKEEFPGIIAWGDSLTAGAGGQGTNYPNVLQQLIKTNIYDIPVINMGVGGENTNTIMGRAGSVPFVVNSFTIPNDTSKVEITITSSNGNSVSPLRQGDKGVNPVTINGITGTISIEQASYTSPQFTYYFNRTESGTPVNVADGTIITTATTSQDYQNYIPIVFMGQYEGWSENPEELISQIKSVVNMDKWNDKYLVLGLTSGTSESRADLELAMQTEFGDRYINLRAIIVKSGLEELGIDASQADLNALNEGSIPPSLLFDEIHFNSSGYTFIAQVIYDRMVELGYFDKIKELIEERNSI